jgi:hypothetical protein
MELLRPAIESGNADVAHRRYVEIDAALQRVDKTGVRARGFRERARVVLVQ